MTEQEKYLLAIQLARQAAELVQSPYGPLADRMAELALELLGQKAVGNLPQ